MTTPEFHAHYQILSNHYIHNDMHTSMVSDMSRLVGSSSEVLFLCHNSSFGRTCMPFNITFGVV